MNPNPLATPEQVLRGLIIGAVVTQLRARAGLTQGRFATRLGREQSTVSRIENGHERVDNPYMLNDLAFAFGYTLAQFTGFIDRAYATAVQTVETAIGHKDWLPFASALSTSGLAGLAAYAVAITLNKDQPNA